MGGVLVRVDNPTPPMQATPINAEAESSLRTPQTQPDTELTSPPVIPGVERLAAQSPLPKPVYNASSLEPPISGDGTATLCEDSELLPPPPARSPVLKLFPPMVPPIAGTPQTPLSNAIIKPKATPQDNIVSPAASPASRLLAVPKPASLNRCDRAGGGSSLASPMSTPVATFQNSTQPVFSPPLNPVPTLGATPPIGGPSELPAPMTKRRESGGLPPVATFQKSTPPVFSPPLNTVPTPPTPLGNAMKPPGASQRHGL
jgi:hypothetical protein